ERDNRNHIYHYNAQGKLIKQVTKGNWDVTAFYGYDAQNKELYYQSTERGSVNRDVYAIGLNGKHKRLLSKNIGTNTANFSQNFEYFINTFNSTTSPNVYTVQRAPKGSEVRVIADNQKLKDKLRNY